MTEPRFIDLFCGIGGMRRLTRAGLSCASMLAIVRRNTDTERPPKMHLYRNTEPNAELLEFKCVEFSENLLYNEFLKEPLP